MAADHIQRCKPFFLPCLPVSHVCDATALPRVDDDDRRRGLPARCEDAGGREEGQEGGVVPEFALRYDIRSFYFVFSVVA